MSTRSPTPLPRYHSLDRLRALMMLLGLVLHSCVSYLPFHPPEIAWIYQDAQTSAFLGWLFAFIHIFRMPVFFVIAGFFAAYLQSSRGTRAFLRHRLSRVGIPLVYGWLIIYR
ncbi:MAG: acyltransferase family protein [Gemmatimonadetes bacterium]|nr:acyltransferase family protein [Gemmatimonadota bacterium]